MQYRFRLASLLLPLIVLPTLLRSQETSRQAPTPPPPVAISGQLRLRTELDDRHISTDETVWIHFLRTRLRATARPISGITVVAELQDSRYLGSGDPTQARGTTDIAADGLDMHQAWAQVDSVFNLPIDLRVGRQEMLFANERLIGISNWSNTGRAFDGARATLHAPALTLDAFGARLSAPVAGPTASQNLYGLWGNWKPADGVSADIFALNDNNTAKMRRGEDSGEAMLQRYTFGALIKGTAGPMDVEIEGADQTGNTASNDSVARRTIQSFLASATITATLDASSKTRLYVLGTVLSGDGSATDNRNETFSTLFGTNHRFYGAIDYVPELAGDHGLVDLGVGVSSVPAKDLKLVLDAHLLKAQRGGEEFGKEADLTTSWRAAPPFEILFGGAIFLPGDLLKARVGDSMRSWAYLAGQWEF